VFVLSGSHKLAEPAAFVATLHRMHLFWPSLVCIAWIMGPVEVGLGLALLVSRTHRVALKITSFLLTGFLILSTILVSRRFTGSCGCMPWDTSLHWLGVTRDLALLVLSTCLSSTAKDVSCRFRMWQPDAM
jgi:uncharacterized membrane protein YphA (DoxX/SURF4 family)